MNETKSDLNKYDTVLQQNKETITIVYFDLRVTSERIIERTNVLRDINDLVLVYSNIDECVNYIRSVKKEKIIFVTTEEDVGNSLSHIENIRQVDGIFVVLNQVHDFNEYKSKVTGVYVNNNDLAEGIKKHMRIVQDQLQVFSFYRRHQRYIRNLTSTSPEFLWFHIFKDVVTRLPHDDVAKNEMLSAARHYYRNNTQELKRIDEFEQVYKSADAIRWYTKNSFVYRLVNKALRTEDIEQMYTFRYFIQDLYSALLLKHKVFREFNEPVTVYRGLRLTQSEFSELIKDQQQLISMNGYLSTSFTRGVADIYAGVPTPDRLSVLLEIECNVPELGDKVIFGDISSESNFQDENEVLFDIGATFQLTNEPKQMENGVWHLKMAATDQGREVVREYINDHLQIKLDTSATIEFGRLLYEMGKYGSALNYFRKLINNSEGENQAAIHIHMGEVLSIQNDRDNAWKHHEIAYKLAIEAQPKDTLYAAQALVEMSLLCFDRNENDTALEYVTRAMELFKQIPDGTIIEMIRAILIIGSCYEQKGKYSQAIEFYNQGIQIHEQSGEQNHVIKCRMHLTVGLAYRLQSNYTKALAQFQSVLDIRTRTLPKQHADIADCLSLIGKTLSDMDCQAEAIVYLLRAYNMYNATLPNTELMEKSSILVDIGVSLSSVDVHDIAIKYFHEALSMKKNCLPQMHPDFCAIYENIAHSYSCLSKHLLASRYSLKAFRLRRKICNFDHPEMVGTLQVLAIVFMNMGCYHRAIHYLMRARKIIKRTQVQQVNIKKSVKLLIRKIKKKLLHSRYRISKIWINNVINSKRVQYLKELYMLLENIEQLPSISNEKSVLQLHHGISNFV